MSLSPSTPDPTWKPLIGWTLAALALCLLWDLGGLDLALAHAFGTPSGFPYRDHWLFSGVLHRGARRVAWTLQLGLVLAVFWPVGPLRLLSRIERVQMLLASLAALLATTLLKDASLTSCPWELTQFGGVARYVSHWSWGVADGGEGNCFPAGHASAAFCFLSGFLALRGRAPRAARIWLLLALAAGALIGLAQQVRGAHYMSHTFWTAWLCWTVCLACHALFALRRPRRS